MVMMVVMMMVRTAPDIPAMVVVMVMVLDRLHARRLILRGGDSRLEERRSIGDRLEQIRVGLDLHRVCQRGRRGQRTYSPNQAS